MHQSLKVLTLGLTALLALGGCADDDTSGTGAASGPDANAAASFPMTVRDCGREVTIEDPPQQVLTMGADPAATVWAAGAADRIIARAGEGGAPLGPAAAALRDVPQITPDGDPSREEIIGTGADLVISYGLNLTTPEDLEAAGIDSLVPSWRCDGSGSGENPTGKVDFDDLFSDIELYGRIFSTQDRATANVAQLRERVQAVRERFANAPKRTGIQLYESDLAYGRESMGHTQMRLLGLNNVFGDVKERFFDVSIEQLLARDPDVILASYGGGGAKIKRAEDARRAVENLPGAKRLTAVREGRVIPINITYMLGSPLAVDGLEMMAESLASFE